jgi:aminobenzoyl-glutamate utilization protein B
MYLPEAYREKLRALNAFIWETAEVKFEEDKSAEAMTSFLQKEGFRVQLGLPDLPTAYVATLGSGRPVLGLLAEYDALSGLSQEADTLEPKKRPGSDSGHGCGHNLLGTGVLGGAILLRDYLREHLNAFTLKVFGCPAEEGGSGKTYMARAGLFDEVDAALTWHAGTMNSVMTGRMLANIQAEFTFTGRASHAAAAPELGRSALDAVELMNVGANYLREHMAMTDRVHYAVLDTGGVSPNVVQAKARVLYLIRSETIKGAQDLYRRVQKIAQGAALMTETQVAVRFDKACSEVVPNEVLARVCYQQMQRLGPPKRTEVQRDYLKRYQTTVEPERIVSDRGLAPDVEPEEREELIRQNPYGEFILPYHPTNLVMPGSSDMGDVSFVTPLVQFHTACFALGTAPHSWQWTAQGKSEVALDGLCYAARILADTAVALVEQPELIAQARAELQRRLYGQRYACPIPPEVHPTRYRR